MTASALLLCRLRFPVLFSGWEYLRKSGADGALPLLLRLYPEKGHCRLAPGLGAIVHMVKVGLAGHVSLQ